MTSPYISKEFHDLQLEQVKRDYERRIADLQHQPMSVLDVLNQNKDDKYCLYTKTKEPAKFIKILIQMTIGIGLLVSVVSRLAIFFFQFEAFHFSVDLSWLVPIVDFLSHRNVLEIVGEGLALSASIELIYMLFTDGLDEAVNPLIIGTASGILILLSRDSVAENSVSILLLTIVLTILFTVQRIFFRETHEDEEEDENPSTPKAEYK